MLLVTYFSTVWAQVPSSEDAQRIIQQKIQTESKGCMKLNSFKKTDGIERQVFGAKVYTLKYEAEIQFLEECKWLQDITPGSPHAGFNTVKSTAQSQKEGGFWGGYLSQIITTVVTKF
jgi:hypothetical protein